MRTMLRDEARALCALCGEPMPLELLMGHLRGAHDIEEDIETWPDGSPVIVDRTLRPEDFAGAM